MITDLIVNPVSPLVITGNFDALKASMVEGLVVYEIEVTLDNLAEAKRMATDLNALSKTLKTTKSSYAKEFSLPIEVFKAQVEELEKIAQESREKILSQVKKFEDDTRNSCKMLTQAHLVTTYEALEVRAEYRTGIVDGLVGLSAITRNGKLTKAACESIEGLAQQGRIAQDRVDGRIAKLEAECFKAGLETPLQREHVEKWIAETDITYNHNLSLLIKIEVDRQNKTKAAREAAEKKKIQDALEAQQKEADRKAKEQAETEARVDRANREAREVEEKAKREAEAVKNVPAIPKVPEPEKKQPIASPVESSGKIPLTVTVYFQIEARPDYDANKVINYFEAQIKTTKLTGLGNIMIERLK